MTSFGCRSLAAGMAIIFALANAPAAYAQAATYSFNLPAQDLGRSLRAVARRTGSNIVFEPASVRGRIAPALSGSFSAEQAIERLLAGSGLTAQRTNGGSWIIVQVGASQPDVMPAAVADRVGDDAEGQQMVVVGTNIRGVRNRTAPVIILDREYIESTGYATTTRLIESLPQNFALSSQSAPPSFPGVTSDRSQGAAVNLRGIGEGTTLVLLNGRRLALGYDGTAVDISLLPLTAVERVEILTDGASALYGADAVGGVVNFVLRRDFEGAETRLRVGQAPGDLTEYRASQTLGSEWGSGSVLLSGEYYHRDLLPTSARDFVPANTQIASLLPRDDNASLFASAHQDLGGAISLFADAFYAHRDTFNRGGRFNTLFAEDSDSSIDQLSANVGLSWQAGGGWRIEASGGYGRYDRFSIRGGRIGLPPSDSDALFDIWQGELKADGPIFDLPGGPVRAAVGGSYRSESFSLLNTQNNVVVFDISEDQRVASAYAELSVPIFGNPNAAPGFRRLELSLAARYDDYSSFGSSVDPRIGLAWEPVRGLLLRGAWGTSYVAPKLSDLDPSLVSAAALFGVDPGAPGGISYQLQVAGGADVPSLRAQESRNITLGLELAPPEVLGLRLALGYYDIRYDNQIALPPQSTSVLLGNPAAFGSLFIRNPTIQQVQQYIELANSARGFFPFDAFFQFDPNFDPASVQVIVDARRRNLAEVRTRGLDFSASYDFDVNASNFRLGLDGVYIFERTQRVTATSLPFDTVDTLFNPPELRLRGSAGWRRGDFSANLFVNHVDSYTDNRVAPFIPVESWTTIDANLAFRFGARRGLLSGVTLTLSAINLFNRDPPAVLVRNPLFEIGFDPSNANPLGRLVAFEIAKRW